jgi:hypothetical protein
MQQLRRALGISRQPDHFSKEISRNKLLIKIDSYLPSKTNRQQQSLGKRALREKHTHRPSRWIPRLAEPF